jgi:hypothetical protein
MCWSLFLKHIQEPFMLDLTSSYIRQNDNGTQDLMLRISPNHFLSYRAAQRFGYKLHPEVHKAAVASASVSSPQSDLQLDF